MQIREISATIPASKGYCGPIEGLNFSVPVLPGDVPLRFVVIKSGQHEFQCELIVADKRLFGKHGPESVFAFRKKESVRSEEFNVVMLIPTGVGCCIGGHAGDATGVAQLLAQVADNLILNPNVVNASDINEMPSNAMYVEGSVITRLLTGVIGLQKTRKNRVLVILDGDHDERFTDSAVNSVNAARACYGFDCAGIVRLSPCYTMKAQVADSGRASGQIDKLESLFNALKDFSGQYDAVALTSPVELLEGDVVDYFQSKEEIINPWGGVEAMLSHAVSSYFHIPSAHAPMMESLEVANADLGVVDPRMAAEAVSLSFINCILKGLGNSPRIISSREQLLRQDVMSVEDIDCLIIPDGCLGLPVLAALEQDITVIAVKENKNLMSNDLSMLPWAPSQFFQAENYREAAGLLLALRAGLSLTSLKRPLNAILPALISKDEYKKGDEKSETHQLASVRGK